MKLHGRLILVAAMALGACGGGGGEKGATEPASDGGAEADADADAGLVVRAEQEIVLMQNLTPTLGNAGSEIVVMNLDGSERRRLTQNDKQEFLPHFSPDGSRLVFTRYLTGTYDQGGETRVTLYDFETSTERDLTTTGKDSYPVWSPDGARIAFLSSRESNTELYMMNADGSDQRVIAAPEGPVAGGGDDLSWGDIAWSSDDWILFVVVQILDGCLKTRMDKIRPDGTARTRVTDGGPSCTPEGFEQSGDADPGFSPDGKSIYSSRGFPSLVPDLPGKITERRLFKISADAWYAGKPEIDVSVPGETCVEGVPKASPDGEHVLLFRACAGAPFGIYRTDAAGSTRTFVADGFGPDFNPSANRR